MKGFVAVNEEELYSVNGRGGSSPSTPSKSSGGSNNATPAASNNPTLPGGGNYGGSPAGAGYSGVSATQREIDNAKALVNANSPYGTIAYVQAPKDSLVGKAAVPMSSKQMDCSAAMSAVTGNPYQTATALTNPAVAKASGYTQVADAKQPGTWTVVTYTEADGTKSAHTQMTLSQNANGTTTYFDSVAAGARGRTGPSTSSQSVVTSITKAGGTVTSTVYLQPTK